MRPNFALYGAATAVALVTLACAEATPSYESDYGHVDEYKSNNYKHEAKYLSSYESDYKHEPSYGSHYEEDYGYEEYTPSHYKPKYLMAPSYKHQPSYKHKRSVGYGSPYGSQSYKHKLSYRHRRSVEPAREGQQLGLILGGILSGVLSGAAIASPLLYLLRTTDVPTAGSTGSRIAMSRCILIDETEEGLTVNCDPPEAFSGEDDAVQALGGFFGRKRSVEPEREGQSLAHLKEQLAKGLMDCPVAEGGEPECGCECSKFWYWQGGEKNGDCNKLSDLGVPFCYLFSPNSCTQAHTSSLVPNGKWKHCV